MSLDRIRKGATPHVYLREWRKHLRLTAPIMAERLEVTREHYLWMERNSERLNVLQLGEVSEALGISLYRLFEPPPEPGVPVRPSLDELVRDASDEQVEGLAQMVGKLVARR